jgi:circadian clock protein KaiB
MTHAAAVDRWVLTLYVNGASPNSVRAIETARRLCDEELDGAAELEIVDVHQRPDLVARDQVVAVPTLVGRLPGRLRRIAGDLSDSERLRLELDLRPAGSSDGQPGPRE